MNKTIGETISFIDKFIPLVQETKEVDIVIAPSFPSLSTASNKLKNTNIMLAAQDVFYEDIGAFTGEISPIMLVDTNCNFVIIGHSERRLYFNEIDIIINKKIKTSLKHKLDIIFCIGETLKEREENKTFAVLKRQLEDGLKGIEERNLDRCLVIAYEPVWAIGTGKTATPQQAQESHNYIRKTLKDLYYAQAENIRILYGGSVTPDNINSIMECKDIDGALVGGASLNPDTFAKIVNFKIN